MNKDEILIILKEQFGGREINHNTTLNYDLGYTVGDMYGFVLFLEQRFDVDMSNFSPDEYFEEDDNFPFFIRLFFKKKKRNNMIPLTIGHIINVIISKKWYGATYR
ncbi:MAG: hypothetical protein OHK0038_27140 [Flammeovirgaceae bacterium]